MLALDLPAAVSRLLPKNLVDAALSKTSSEKNFGDACEVIYESIMHPREHRTGYLYEPIQTDVEAVSTVVLYIATEALSNVGRFDASSQHVTLLEKVAKRLQPEGRYYLLSSFFDQLRYPNSHSIFFSNLIQHFFGTESAGTMSSEIRDQIARILMERLGCNGPHPYFGFLLFLELQGNQKYHFWDLPFLGAVPDAKQVLSQIVKACGGRGEF